MASEWKVGDILQTDIETWEVRKILLGGMGAVLIVYEPERKDIKAAKTFQASNNPALAGGFLRECKAWLNVDRHENVAQAEFIRRIDDQPFLFLEFVSGGDLARWIGTPALLQDPSQVLLFAVQFCDGLGHAISRGIQAHRDIKPANCLVTETGTLKVTDFGLAKLRVPELARNSESPAIDDQPNDRTDRRSGRLANWMRTTVWAPRPRRPTGHETQTGIAMGTPPYMAPEQFADVKRVDVRADVYSFGVMLFQMASGRLPFVGRDLASFASLHSTGTPPHLENDPQLDAIVQKCLAKRPADRFGAFAEIREELGRIYRRVADRPPPEPRMGTELENEHWLGKSLNFVALGMMQDAEECFERFMRLEPDFMAKNPHFKPPRLTRRGLVFETTPAAERDVLAQCEAILAENPEDRDALVHKGVSLLYFERPAEAMVALDRALDVDGIWAPAWFNKGLALQQLHRLEEALVCFEAAGNFVRQTDQHRANQDELERKVFHAKGHLEIELGRFEQAVKSFERALKNDPRSLEAWNAKALAFDKLGNDAEVASCLARLTELEPRDALAWRNLAIGVKKLGAPEEALQHVARAIEIAPTDALAWQLQGEILYDLGRREDALHAYEEALALDPTAAAPWGKKGILLGLLQRYGEAIDSLEEAERLGYDVGPSLEVCRQQFADTRFERGLALLQAGAFDGAIADFTAVIEVNQSHDAYHNRALAKGQKRDLDGAIADYSHLIALDAEDALAHGGRGGMRMMKCDFAGAAADCTEAIRLNPDDPIPYVNRGHARSLLGNHAGAIADLSRAIDLGYVDAYQERAYACFDAYRWREALADFERVRERSRAGHPPRFVGIDVMEGDVERRIWLIRARLRESPQESEIAEFIREQSGGDEDEETVLALLLTGRLSDAKALEYEEFFPPEPGAPALGRCEMYFYAGALRLIAGDAAGAIERFRVCIETGVRGSRAYVSAQAELRRLEI